MSVLKRYLNLKKKKKEKKKHICLLSCALQNENIVKYVSEIKATLELVENVYITYLQIP